MKIKKGEIGSGEVSEKPKPHFELAGRMLEETIKYLESAAPGA